MKLIKNFERFLLDTVNLDKTRYNTAGTGIEAITTFLKSNELLKNYFIDTSPQGSYKQKTIIRPVSEEFEFDVDLLFEMMHVEGWEAKDYLINIATELRNTDKYKDKVDTKDKSRCVTIDYESDFHIDIVPAIKTDNGHWIMNKKTNEFEMTDGDGYAQWFENQTVITNGFLAETVRLIKFLRDSKEIFEANSILLTTLLGNQVYYETDTFEKFPDLPTTLRLLIYRLDQYLQANLNMPTVTNPTLPEEDFNRHWNQEKYSTFRDAINDLLNKINNAYTDSDEEESIKKWRIIFGDNFPSSVSDLEHGSTLPAYQLGNYSHFESLKWDENLIYKVRIDGYLYSIDKTKLFRGINSDAKFGSNLSIKYVAKPHCPAPYTVYWQVVNTGTHAASLGSKGLRGQIFISGNQGLSSVQWETSLYTGKHWIECFIVKDDICVARRKFFINITNPNFR